MEDNSLLERISEIMMHKKLSQSSLAEILQVSSQNINAWFRHERAPSPKQILRIIDIYRDINPYWIINGEEPMKLNKSIVEESSTIK